MRCGPAWAAIAALMIAVQPAAAQPASSGGADWRIHVDPDSGLKLDYPAGIFRVEAGSTEIGTGRRLRSADGRAELTVYTLPNTENDTPRSYLAKKLLLDRSQIIYRRVSDRFFVLSSIRNDRIFYSRCNFGRAMRCFYLEYPQSEKRAWDHIVTRMSRSLS